MKRFALIFIFTWLTLDFLAGAFSKREVCARADKLEGFAFTFGFAGAIMGCHAVYGVQK